jgi:hypothetical protein
MFVALDVQSVDRGAVEWKWLLPHCSRHWLPVHCMDDIGMDDIRSSLLSFRRTLNRTQPLRERRRLYAHKASFALRQRAKDA